MLDASGNVITSASHIGNVNPFRYRGYFYDIETGLYYLKTRYYDPVTGRFLNMDSIDYADPETINGLNLYAYCGNNPVMNVDPTGEFFWIIAIILVTTTIAGAVVGGKIASDDGKEGLELAGAVLLGAAMGLAVGGAAIALTGVIAGAIAGVSTTVLGVTAAQAFAIGSVAFDFTAFVVAPIYGIAMQAIEYEAPKPINLPNKPQPTPSHPYIKNKRRLLDDSILWGTF